MLCQQDFPARPKLRYKSEQSTNKTRSKFGMPETLAKSIGC